MSGSPVLGAVVDTVGAGDTFQAALLSRASQERLHQGPFVEETAREMLQYACTAAAINCARVGSDPPTRSELNADR